MSENFDLNNQPIPDNLITEIANYVMDYQISSQEAFETAKNCLIDTIGCGLLALKFPACTKLMGPIVSGTEVPFGVSVPGTSFKLDPVKAAFDIGCAIRWLDFNDTWLAAEWGHPSDNHEIQGILALENSFNRIGLDHVVLVKVASTAVATKILGGTKDDVINAITQAWVDGQSLRTYRHAPNTGSRKSWAAGDATSRAVRLALISLTGEMGYPSVLSTKTWGFESVHMKGESLKIPQKFESYVMENILFKISYPAEFHAQTAVEAAVKLHPLVKNKIDDIERIEIATHESAIRIISKAGELNNPADRDHCLQYMIAIGLLKGNLKAEDYEDDVAKDTRIDFLRSKMHVSEKVQYSKDYLDSKKRSIANQLQIYFKDETATPCIEVEYPIGHKRRREEGIPVLEEKFKQNLLTIFSKSKSEEIFSKLSDFNLMKHLSVIEFQDLLSI